MDRSCGCCLDLRLHHLVLDDDLHESGNVLALSADSKEDLFTFWKALTALKFDCLEATAKHVDFGMCSIPMISSM